MHLFRYMANSYLSTIFLHSSINLQNEINNISNCLNLDAFFPLNIILICNHIHTGIYNS